MSIRENVHLMKCHSGNCPTRKCSFGDLSVWGTLLRRTVHGETVRREMYLGNCPSGKNPLGNVRQGTVLEPMKAGLQFSDQKNTRASKKSNCGWNLKFNIFFPDLEYSERFHQNMKYFATKAVTQMCSVKTVLRNFWKFTGKHLCPNHFFNKVARHRCFTVNFAIFLGTTCYKQHLWLLLLSLHITFRDFFSNTVTTTHTESV